MRQPALAEKGLTFSWPWTYDCNFLGFWPHHDGCWSLHFFMSSHLMNLKIQPLSHSFIKHYKRSFPEWPHIRIKNFLSRFLRGPHRRAIDADLASAGTWLVPDRGWCLVCSVRHLAAIAHLGTSNVTSARSLGDVLNSKITTESTKKQTAERTPVSSRRAETGRQSSLIRPALGMSPLGLWISPFLVHAHEWPPKRHKYWSGSYK